MWKLVRRLLLKHPIRSTLTVASLTVALFLLCFLRSVITTLEAGVEAADQKRLWVQSAVSLFVDFPVSYQAKIESVDGVRETCKWQWFGGYYQEPGNFFAQFAVDPPELFDMWPEMTMVAGTEEEFIARQNGCLIGEALATQFGWSVGDKVPIISAIFPKPDGGAWEFEVIGIYRPTRNTLDNRTFFFHWKYFENVMEQVWGIPPQVGVIVLEAEEGAQATEIMARVDTMFENGPQRVQTTTEAEFTRQFVSMVGNVPRLVGFIGIGVFLAILLGTVNTMLMAAREQTHDVGILKAVGFTDGSMFRLLLAQSLFLCGFGGGLGILLALITQPGISKAMGTFFPGYAVQMGTIGEAVAFTLAVGVLAGIVPALNASRLETVEALRDE